MTMRLGFLEDKRGKRETSTDYDGGSNQNIANNKEKKPISEMLDSKGWTRLHRDHSTMQRAHLALLGPQQTTYSI